MARGDRSRRRMRRLTARWPVEQSHPVLLKGLSASNAGVTKEDMEPAYLSALAALAGAANGAAALLATTWPTHESQTHA